MARERQTRNGERGTRIAKPAPRAERSCFVCGCTEKRACPGGCAWAAKDLIIKISERKKSREVRRSICTRCAHVLGRLDGHRKALGVKDADRVTFELGAFAALRIANRWRG